MNQLGIIIQLRTLKNPSKPLKASQRREWKWLVGLQLGSLGLGACATVNHFETVQHLRNLQVNQCERAEQHRLLDVSGLHYICVRYLPEPNQANSCNFTTSQASIKARRWLLRWWSPGQLWICCGRRSCGLRLSLHCHSLCSRRPVRSVRTSERSTYVTVW